MKRLNKAIEYGLYLLIFLLPWQTRLFLKISRLKGGYFEYGSQSLYLSDIVLVLILILALIARTQEIKNRSRTLGTKIEITIQKISWIFVLFLNLGALVSILAAPDKSVAGYRYLILCLGMGLYWLLASARFDKAKAFFSLAAALGIQAALGIWQFLKQASFASKWLGLAAHRPGELGASVVETYWGERWLRAYGGLDHPNVLGGSLAVGLLVLIFLLVRRLKKEGGGWEKASLFLFYFLSLVALFFTFSRGAWLGLAAGGLIILAGLFLKGDEEGEKIFLKIFVASSLVVALLFFRYHELVLTRFNHDTRLEIRSNQERLESYQVAARLISGHRFGGVGIGNYTIALSKLKPGLEAWAYQPTHNVFLLVWAETGLLGLVGFAGLFLYSFWAARRQVFSLAILAALLAMFSVDHWWWSLHYGMLFLWLVLGMVLALTEEENTF